MKEPQLAILMQWVGYPRVSALKALVKALAGSRPMLIGRSLTFQSAGELRAIAEGCFDSSQLLQEFYEPADLECLTYCAKHHAYSAGIHGCHVCSGFYQ